MGFSIQQARTALAATDSGQDVQGAMEILLAQNAASEGEVREAHEEAQQREEAERRRRQQARRQGPSRATVAPAVRENEPSDETNGDTLNQLADQADKVLAQASEIGASLFNKANSFWKSANKAIEERTKASNAPPPPSTNGRPKWMSEERVQEEHSPARASRGKPSSFRDHDDDEPPEDPVLPPRPQRSARQPERSQPAPSHKPVSKTSSIFDLAGDEPTSYVSPHRRKGGTTRPVAAASSPQPSAPVPTPPPVPSKPPRSYVTCPQAVLQTSSSHRTAGTAAYKLGQYANAEAEFSKAIDLLPSGHMQLVPLWNNRAMSRLKTGDGTGAISDCTSVLDLVGDDWKVGDDASDSSNPHGAGVDLGEALIKAVTRRAMAYEMGEKWDKAKEDWERLAGIGGTWGPAGGKSRAEAVRGLDRCRKMSVPADAPPKPAPTRKPPAPAARRPALPSKPGEATVRLQQANQAAEAEENERYRLKDSVDARLTAWKGGKETNIRALIASLENVLWPELGWAKVGMADLITEQQVKIRYMKAIAKLHPDKVRAPTG